MLFYFIRYVILFPLSKEIPDQNNFTNKIHGYFVTINWDFLFKNQLQQHQPASSYQLLQLNGQFPHTQASGSEINR